jgi:hypothetical protein
MKGRCADGHQQHYPRRRQCHRGRAGARTCVAEADRADRAGQHRYAELLRGSARTALAELDADTPRAVYPETAAARARTRAFAQVIAAGFGQTWH